MPDRELVRRFAVLLKEQTGIGPARCRVFFNDDVVTMVCSKTLTAAEISLLSCNRATAETMRRDLQKQTRAKFAQDVEEVTGRRVVAAMSDHAIEPDSSAYVFLLE